METELAYVAKEECGCMVAAMSVDIAHLPENHREMRDWHKDGLAVEVVSDGGRAEGAVALRGQERLRATTGAGGQAMTLTDAQGVEYRAALKHPPEVCDVCRISPVHHQTYRRLLFRLELAGQVPPGKSNQGRAKDGSTYPKAKSFVPWVRNCKASNPYPPVPFDGRFLMRVLYVPGDNRARNVAGMQDAIMHYLENGGRAPSNKLQREAWKQRRRWIDNDEQIVDVDWKTMTVDREKPMAIVEIWT